ncbi:MAG: GNAT family N-acetyltransferase [Reyranella sp.]|jgi:ribosomal-protein-alanine N-acetyltransferase|uniref:GNAT family N-acetyltransferase n=1 Tax=Reyranella sp. TaxID=1929291 RepID=UPI0025E4BB17|nr:GNAT family N-acetyltransferase [Reyranella sp.]MBR2819517.1 GNAT family N-acetyltransferase [Reyranella sp.]
MTILRTDRLALRPLLPDDAKDYAAMRFHPKVAKWLPPASTDPQTADPETAAHATIDRFAASWQERRLAPWGVFLDSRLIGHGGLNYVPEFDAVEVLWALHPDAWGKGYATEVAAAALDYGFGPLDLASIFAITFEDNLASQAVMKRIGLTYRKRVDYKGFADVVWFDIDRASYAERTSIAAR